MGIYRRKILPGVFLNHIGPDKFKTAFLSLNLLSPLKRETASMNALVPYVLRRGTARLGDMEQIAMRLDELYGSSISPIVRRVGEIQLTGFYVLFPEERFLPKGEGVIKDIIALLGEMLLAPATRGGMLNQSYVESERDKMMDLIRSRLNDKNSYAYTRCIEEMCCFEDYAVGKLGSLSDCEGIHYLKLTKHYKKLLQTSPIEIVYCGSESPKRLEKLLKNALVALPRGEIDYEELGTDIRMNAVEDEVRYREEKMNVNQGKLVIGFRLGECMEEPDIAAIYVFNAVYGGGVVSKLFRNVRERLSLCYFASSSTDLHKGLMLVISGIDFDKYDAVRDEIFAQLEDVKKGVISEEELAAAKAGVISDLAALSDSQGQLEGFYLSRILDGGDFSPEELAELVREVSAEEVAAIAQSTDCDLIYFLKGEDDIDDD